MEGRIADKRIPQIDILRGVAIMLVLFRHYPLVPQIQRIGWAGVDLFFVLSGFLVSTLIYKEFLSTGRFSIKLFLIRRGLKIYPLFYFFILVSVASVGASMILFGYHKSNLGSKVLSEIVFVQNYFEGLWGHTWTLAVEEHFYLLLAASMFLLIKFQPDRIKWLPYSMVIILIGILVLRMVHYLSDPIVEYRTHVYPTHFRLDSLLFGCLIAYYYCFHSQKFHAIFSKSTTILLGLFGLCFLLFAFRYDLTSGFMVTIGFTMLYIGFGALLVAVVSTNWTNLPWIRLIASSKVYLWMAAVGKYSYAIYLFHMFLPSIVDNTALFQGLDFRIRFVLYFVTSIFWGFVFSRLIEIPVLRFRDRLFPRRSVVS